MEERKYVFWNVYILDKCLSLSFGRSPCLPDYGEQRPLSLLAPLGH